MLAASYRKDWLDTCKTTGRIFLTNLPFGDGLMLPSVSQHEQRVEQMDTHPERVSDPVTEENIFQFLHLPSEHRRDCQHGHCWAGTVNQTIICRSTSSEQLNTPLTRQSQNNCWTYQTGSGSFSCKLENKVSSSTSPKSSNIPYCNKDMIILLSSCSEHFKHLVQ